MPEADDQAVTCGHDGAPFGSPICTHLRECNEPWLAYVKWYTGKEMNAELLCRACAEARSSGARVTALPVCERCFRNVTEEVGDLVGSRGRPGIRNRPEPFDTALVQTALPAAIGAVSDLAPIEASSGPTWLLLTEDGRLIRLEAGTLEWTQCGKTTVAAEPEREPWNGHALRRRLHASLNGEFAAVVNDFGRWGEVVDLSSGRTALTLDGGDYHPETVPFSFTFVERQGRTLAVHRTAWNRLDISDPATGDLLSARGPTSCSSNEPRPEHDLDYFHGALLVNPGSTRILDDGWVWHPVGIPSVWSLDRWGENVWESEDGPSRRTVCARDYYWNGPLAWLGDERVAIGGIGDDDVEIVSGARVFDVSSPGKAGPRWRSDWEWAREVNAFPGPAGAFFSDGEALFSSDDTGLSRWDPVTGERTGHLPGYRPSRHHRGARELVELRGRSLVRMPM